MNHDDSLEKQLEGFLHGELDGQCGRAQDAFASRLAVPASMPRSGRRSLLRPLVAASAAATVVMGVMALRGAAPADRMPFAPKAFMAGARSTPARFVTADFDHRVQPAIASPMWSVPPGAHPVQTVSTSYIDDGVILLDGRTPMRTIEVKTLCSTSWFDPKSQANIQVVSPHKQVMLVAVEPF